MKPKVYIQLKDLPDSPKGTEWSIPEGFTYYYPNGDPSYAYAYEEYELLDHPDFWELKEEKRWKPEIGEKYYYIENDLAVSYMYCSSSRYEEKLHEVFNYFKTRKKAEAVAKKTRELWKKESEEDES